MDGWIKLHRKCLENKIFLHDPTAWRVFEYLLLICNHKTGSYDTGRYWLGKALGIKPTTAYNALLRLERCKMVDIKSNNKYSTVSISNWKEYQDTVDTTNDNKMTTKRQQNDNKMTLNKKEEVRKKNKEVSRYPKMILDEEREIIKYFKIVYGIKTELPNNNEQIKASKWLFKEKGLDMTYKAINAAFNCRGLEYAPSIDSLMELRDKYGKLEEFYKRKKENGRSKNVIG